MTNYDAYRIVHILFAALWIGARMATSGDARRTLEKGKPCTELLAGRMRRAATLDAVAGIVTVVSGFLLLGAMGGMAAVKAGVHIGLTAGVLCLLASLFLVTPAGSKVRAGIEADDLDAARAASKRFAAFLGVQHLLWLVALVAMCWPG